MLIKHETQNPPDVSDVRDKKSRTCNNCCFLSERTPSTQVRVRRPHPTPPATVDLPGADHTTLHWPPLNCTPVGERLSLVAVLRSCVQLCRFFDTIHLQKNSRYNSSSVALEYQSPERSLYKRSHNRKHTGNQQCTAVGSPGRRFLFPDTNDCARPRRRLSCCLRLCR